jgi:outer membrane protein OmpA-like peptidoglycan-associated protein
MHPSLQSGIARRATVTLGAFLLMQGAVQAQTVRMFEVAPSIEQLRSIMIPESHGGQGRSIVLFHPDAMPRTNAVQAALTQPADPLPAMPVGQSGRAPAAAPVHPVVMAATIPSAEAVPAPHADARDIVDQSGADQPGIVGFRIHFALDSAALPSTATVFLDRMAELLIQEPRVKLRVEGHTDARGTPDYNQSLSERRAAAVADYLVQRRGIAAARLVIEGKGVTEPMTRDPYDGQNRRVQFVRLG